MILEVAEGYPGNVKKKRNIFGSAASKGSIPATEPSYSSYPSPEIFFVFSVEVGELFLSGHNSMQKSQLNC